MVLIGLIILTSTITTVAVIANENDDSTIRTKLLIFPITLCSIFGAFCSQGCTYSYDLIRYFKTSLHSFYYFSAVPTGLPFSKFASVRLIHLVTHLTAILILGAYSAFLISSISSRYLDLPFHTLQGLTENEEYKFGVSEGSAEYKILRVSLPLKYYNIKISSYQKCR